MSNSHISCCVPKCNQKGTAGPDGQKVGFFCFPKDKNLKKVWIAKIRRDEGKDFEVKDDTKVCSLHFDQSEISKGFGGKMSLKRRSEVFPTKFAWRTSPCKRKPPTPRFSSQPKPAKRRCIAKEAAFVFSNQNMATTSTSDQGSSAAASGDSKEQEREKPSDSSGMDLETLKTEVSKLQSQNQDLKQQLEKALAAIADLRGKVANLEDKNSKLSKREFCFENLSEDSSVVFYTGFPNAQAFEATFKYLNPGETGENIRFWRSADHSVDTTHYTGGQQSKLRKRGLPRAMNPKQEFFLVMCRLRQALPEKHLSFLFGVSQSTVSRIFISWINFMFLRFGTINIWPSRAEVNRLMPEDFKAKYPNTRVIIDCTEIRCQMPSSLLLNSELFSNYKNNTTLKGLVGISPAGAVTFISQLYTGSISDRSIVERSGILDLPFDDKDCVMADKGFTISDLLPFGVVLNIPPFLGQAGQMSAEQVVQTQQIAGLRIHVERAINKIKNFHIWDGVVPISLFGVVNQMWAVCSFLCNLQDPILSQ